MGEKKQARHIPKGVGALHAIPMYEFIWPNGAAPVQITEPIAFPSNGARMLSRIKRSPCQQDRSAGSPKRFGKIYLKTPTRACRKAPCLRQHVVSPRVGIVMFVFRMEASDDSAWKERRPCDVTLVGQVDRVEVTSFRKYNIGSRRHHEWRMFGKPWFPSF